LVVVALGSACAAAGPGVWLGGPVRWCGVGLSASVFGFASWLCSVAAFGVTPVR